MRSRSKSPLKDLIADVCRLIDKTRGMAQARRDDPAVDAAVRRASAFVELALEALEGPAADAGASSVEQIADLAGRLAEFGPLPKSGRGPAQDAGDGEGFVGSSAVIPVPELLSFLRGQGKTGLLRVQLERETIHLHLRDGDLAHAFSDNPPVGSRLSDLLVEQGAVEPWLLEKLALQYSKGAAEGGRAMRLEQIATQEQLRAARVSLIQRLFHRLFEAEEALFSFQEGEMFEATGGNVINLIQLLLETARDRDEALESRHVDDPAWTPPPGASSGLGGWLLGGEEPPSAA